MSDDSALRRCRAAGWLGALLLAAPPAVAEDEAVDPQFLEFLALWETEDEDWFDAAMEDETGAAAATRPATPEPDGPEPDSPEPDGPEPDGPEPDSEARSDDGV